MSRLASLCCGAAVVVVAVPAAADGASVKLDHRCYVAGQEMVASGTGFTPGSALTLGGDESFPGAVADPMGNFVTGLAAPPPARHGARPSSVTHAKLTVSDPANPAATASARYELANFTVDRGTTHDPRAVRTWYFSGFPARTTVYGHFRWKGRTLVDHRFGKVHGACGLLHARAAGIPVSPLHTGAWTVQLDGRRHYKTSTRPALVLKVSIVLR